jgi:hypothetical protein
MKRALIIMAIMLAASIASDGWNPNFFGSNDKQHKHRNVVQMDNGTQTPNTPVPTPEPGTLMDYTITVPKLYEFESPINYTITTYMTERVKPMSIDHIIVMCLFSILAIIAVCFLVGHIVSTRKNERSEKDDREHENKMAALGYEQTECIGSGMLKWVKDTHGEKGA